MDGLRTLKLLITATKHLAARSASPMAGDEAFSEGSRLVAEAGVALDRLRKLGELQELLVEVTALVAAGVDPAEVDAKLGRATGMANDLAVELGAVAPDAMAAPASEQTRGGFAESESEARVTLHEADPRR
jgi:hypothetical protein